MTPRLAVAMTAAISACVSTQRPALQPISSADRALTLRLEDGEDLAHALTVASRRLRRAGISDADLTAAGSVLSVRLPARDAPRALAALLQTAWLRARMVDPRVELTALLPTPTPPGLEVLPEQVTLAAGLSLRGDAVYGSRAALESLSAATGSVAVVPAGSRWQLVAVEPRVAIDGAQVTRCALASPGEVTVEFDASVEALRAAARASGRARRVVFEIDGGGRAMTGLLSTPTIALPREGDAASFVQRCADGLLRAPLREEDQSPSQGTGSRVAP